MGASREAPLRSLRVAFPYGIRCSFIQKVSASSTQSHRALGSHAQDAGLEGSFARDRGREYGPRVPVKGRRSAQGAGDYLMPTRRWVFVKQ
jgi:hypothetical protein